MLHLFLFVNCRAGRGTPNLRMNRLWTNLLTKMNEKNLKNFSQNPWQIAKSMLYYYQRVRETPRGSESETKNHYKMQWVFVGWEDSYGVPPHSFEPSSPHCSLCLRLGRQRDDVRSSRTADKKFLKTFKKPLDKSIQMWYNNYRK